MGYRDGPTSKAICLQRRNSKPAPSRSFTSPSPRCAAVTGGSACSQPLIERRNLPSRGSFRNRSGDRFPAGRHAPPIRRSRSAPLPPNSVHRCLQPRPQIKDPERPHANAVHPERLAGVVEPLRRRAMPFACGTMHAGAARHLQGIALDQTESRWLERCVSSKPSRSVRHNLGRTRVPGGAGMAS